MSCCYGNDTVLERPRRYTPVSRSCRYGKRINTFGPIGTLTCGATRCANQALLDVAGAVCVCVYWSVYRLPVLTFPCWWKCLSGALTMAGTEPDRPTCQTVPFLFLTPSLSVSFSYSKTLLPYTHTHLYTHLYTHYPSFQSYTHPAFVGPESVEFRLRSPPIANPDTWCT